MSEQRLESLKLSPWEAIKTQLRVLHALLLRESSLRMGPYKLGHLLVLTEVIWGTTVLGILHYLVGAAAPVGNSVVFYYFTGMFAYITYRVLHGRVSSALEANKALLSYPVIRPVDTMLARAGLESSLQLLAFLLFYSAFIMLGWANFPAHSVELLAAIAATVILGFGMGVTGMVLRNLWSPWRTVDNMISRILFFISGIFFSVEYLPPYIRDVLVWNPLVHAIEWVRYCIYPEYFTQILDREYLLAWGLIATIFGLGMERLIRPRLLER